MTMFRIGRSRSANRLLAPAMTVLGAAAGAVLAAPHPAWSQAAPPTATAKPAGKEQHYTDWPVFGGGALRNDVSDETVAPPLSLLWRFSAAQEFDDKCAPIVAAGTVYYASRSTVGGPGTLFALDPATGSEKWSAKLNGNNLFSTAPMYDNGIVYIGSSNGSVYAYNATSGQEILHYQTPRPVNSSPIIVSGVLYFGSDDGTLYALDPQTGNKVWHKNYVARDSINCAPVIANSFIFLTTSGNTIEAIKQGTGQGRWIYRLPYRVLSNVPMFADNTLYVPAGPRLYAFQSSSGSIRWSRDVPNDILCAPVSSEGIVYTISRDVEGDGAVVNAINSGNGKFAWKKGVALPVVPSAAPTISGNVMYIPTVRNLIIAISLDDGHLLWQFRVDPSVNSANVTPRTITALTTPLTISGGSMYALSDDGALSAFRPGAPDKTGPNLYNMYPAPAARVNGAPPLILATYVNDAGSGVNPDSIKMSLDDKDVTATYDAYRNLVMYRTKSSGKIVDPPLSNGRHSATVTIADWKGNVTTQTWSFVVDSTVPQYTKTSVPARPRN